MPDRGRASWRGDVVAALVIGAIAFLPRLLVLTTTPVATPLYDLAEYWDRTVFIIENGRLYENSTRMPGYPVALAIVLTLFGAGPSLAAARIFNAIAGAVAAMLTYWLARRSAGRAASTIAACVMALYPSFLIYTAFTATEAVVTVPLMGALVAASYSSRGAAIAAGACTALATLVRPAGVAMLPAVLVAALMGRPLDARAAQRVALLAAAFVLLLLPWWAHNLRLHGRFVPLDASGGINMAIGNNPQASGTYRYREATHLYALGLTPVEVATPDTSDRAAAFAVSYIREHPRAFLALIPAKLAALFALEGREVGFVYTLGFFGPRSESTVTGWAYALALSFPPLVAVALAGLAVRGGVSRAVVVPSLVWIAATVAMHVVSFGDPRYHLPMVPVLAVFATGLARGANGFSRVRLAAGALLLALLAVAWSQQWATYRDVLPRLAAPGGWSSQISYDDLF